MDERPPVPLCPKVTGRLDASRAKICTRWLEVSGLFSRSVSFVSYASSNGAAHTALVEGGGWRTKTKRQNPERKLERKKGVGVCACVFFFFPLTRSSSHIALLTHLVEVQRLAHGLHRRGGVPTGHRPLKLPAGQHIAPLEMAKSAREERQERVKIDWLHRWSASAIKYEYLYLYLLRIVPYRYSLYQRHHHTSTIESAQNIDPIFVLRLGFLFPRFSLLTQKLPKTADPTQEKRDKTVRILLLYSYHSPSFPVFHHMRSAWE